MKELCINPNKSIVNKLKKNFPNIPIICFPKGINENINTFIKTVNPHGISIDYDINLKKLDLTIDLITEKGKKIQQRNDLFDGTEIIVGTARRICEMYFQNGFNISKMRVFVVLEMDAQMRQGVKGYILRIAESLPKCKQLLLTKNGDETRIQEYIDEVIPTIRLIE